MIDKKKDPEDAACFVYCNQAGYDRVAPDFYETHHKFLDQKAIVEFSRRIKNQAMVLDAGCGTGNYTEALLNNNLNVVGADISASMLAFACRHVDPERLLQMDVLNPCFKERSFDAIWMKATMVHISTVWRLSSSGVFEASSNQEVSFIYQCGTAEELNSVKTAAFFFTMKMS